MCIRCPPRALISRSTNLIEGEISTVKQLAVALERDIVRANPVPFFSPGFAGLSLAEDRKLYQFAVDKPYIKKIQAAFTEQFKVVVRFLKKVPP